MTDGIFKAIGFIVGAFFLFNFYKLARDYGEKSKNIFKSIGSALLGIVIVAFIISSGLGTHSENCDDDPLRGSCDTVQDYQPSTKEYQDSFLFWLFVVGSPIIYGLYEGNKNRRNNIDDGSVLNIDQAKEILSEYGKVVETVSVEALTKYPTMKYPISLLPCSKVKIKKAASEVIKFEEELNESVKKLNIKTDNNYINAIKGCIAMIDFFVPDKEANEDNQKLLSEKDWKKLIKNKTKKS